MNTNDHDLTFIAKNAAVKINFHSYLFLNVFKWQYVFMIFWSVDYVSWGMILKICFKFFSNIFFPKKCFTSGNPDEKNMVIFGSKTRQHFQKCTLALVLVLYFSKNGH